MKHPTTMIWHGFDYKVAEYSNLPSECCHYFSLSYWGLLHEFLTLPHDFSLLFVCVSSVSSISMLNAADWNELLTWPVYVAWLDFYRPCMWTSVICMWIWYCFCMWMCVSSHLWCASWECFACLVPMSHELYLPCGGHLYLVLLIVMKT